MQKWEYCTVLIDIARRDEPAAVIINKADEEPEIITAAENEKPHAPIGKLGQEGWRMKCPTKQTY